MAWRRPDDDRPYLDGLGSAERVVVHHELVGLEIAVADRSGRPPAPEEVTSASRTTSVVAAAFAPSMARPRPIRRPGAVVRVSTEDTEPDERTPDGAEPTEMGRVRGGGRGYVPRRLGRFQVVRLLGQGSSGSVYLARDDDLDRDVAIKVPRPRWRSRVDSRPCWPRPGWRPV